MLMTMRYGVVKSVSFERGFGFIDAGGKKDVYFHATVVEDGAFDRIGPEQAVMFELAPRQKDDQPDKGPRAKTVRLIDRLPGGILPPPTQAQAPRHHPKARQRKPTWRKQAR
jgi:cold shock CspA family protein